MLDRDLTLEDEVCSIRPAHRIVQQEPQQPCCQTEGRVGGDTVGHPRQTESLDADSDHPNVRCTAETDSEALGPYGVGLDRPHLGTGRREWNRERSDPGTDVDDQVVGSQMQRADELERDRVSEEVLTECPPSDVACAAATMLGHGTSPLSSWRPP